MSGLARAVLAELLTLPDEELAPLAERLVPLLPPPPPPDPAGPLLTIPEAAELLRCKRGRVDDLLSQGRLTRVKDGRRTLLRRADVERYLRTAC